MSPTPSSHAVRSASLALVALASLVVLACTNSKAPAPPGAKPAAQDTGTGAGTGTGSGRGWERDEDDARGRTDSRGGEDDGDEVDLTPSCDPDKDFHMLEYPPEIQECLKKKKLYNFDATECTAMNKSYEGFDCTFDGVKKELADLELSAAPLEREKQRGGKLISCGVSNDGTTIVTQFFYKNADAKKNDCKFSKAGRVVSVCFRLFTADDPPPVPTTEAGMRAYVKECMANE